MDLMLKNETKGQIEAKISEVITKFHREHVGKGPGEVKSHIIEDMIVIRLKGALTPIERDLANNSEGIALVKRCRTCLLENSKSILEKLLQDSIDIKINSFYADVNPKTEEMFIVVGLSKDIEAKFLEQHEKKS